MNPIMYVLGTVVLISAIANGWMKITINGLNDDVQGLEMKLSQADMNHKVMVSTVEEQNRKIKLVKVDLVLRTDELEEWRAKPPEIRYNVIYKTIKQDVDLKDNGCETTQSVINSIRGIDFNIR